MADVRVNGRRIALLQTETKLKSLVDKLDQMAARSQSCLTFLTLNGEEVDLDNLNSGQIDTVGNEDVIEAKIENTAQLSFESLQVAQEMAELLVFDIKVATLKMWDSSTFAEAELNTLLRDCHSFLTLGSHPLDLLQRTPTELSASAQDCLRELDKIAQCVEDGTLLAVHGHQKDACHVLVGRVMPSIERWLGLTATFAKELEIDRIQAPALAETAEIVTLRPASAGPSALQITR